MSFQNGDDHMTKTVILDAVAAYYAGDYTAALRLFRKLAEEGSGEQSATGQFSLGVMYDHGQGVAQDYAEAVKWYRLAADQGHPQAQGNLGVMYHEGAGVAQDDAEAARWYRKAADQGDAAAQFNLDLVYADSVRATDGESNECA